MNSAFRILVLFVFGIVGAQLYAGGNLKVTIAPSAAVTAGAQWRVDGGAWQASGATVKGLFAGTHNVEFKALNGWTEPPLTMASIKNGTTTTLASTYVQTASLTVTLAPAAGQWRIDGGAWRNSGTSASGLTPGVHNIEYAPLSGYTNPANESISLAAGQAATLSRSYSALAWATVTLSPNHAQWRIDGGAWRASDTTAGNLAPGSHTIEYQPLAGYTAPAAESVTLASGQAFSVSRSYIQLAQVSVTLTPSSAQWRIDGGAWRSSGTTATDLALGNHTIDYSTLAGYATPSSDTISLSSGQSLAIDRAYVQLGSLNVALTPSTGQWRLDGGGWQNTSTTLNNLSLGSHTVEFSPLEGYITPASATVTIVSGPNSLSRTYTQLASFNVTLTPSYAQWRIDGGAWLLTSTTLNNLPLGSHTVEFSTIEGYTAPVPATVTLVSGPNSLSRTYTPLASFNVSLDPSFAQWRLDGGPWQFTSTTLNNLPLGSHTVDYSTIEGYITLASESVTLVSGPNSLSRTYTQLASLNVALTPSSGQWRIDGGAWQNTFTSLNFLALGTHTIDYAPLTGYLTPSSETISLASGPNFLSRTYSPAGPAFEVIKAFADTGSGPTMVLASDNRLYVAINAMGTSGGGNLFRMNRDGSGYTLLKAFGTIPGDGLGPNSLIESVDGALYGTTFNGGAASNTGTIFKINKDGTGYVILRTFEISSQGSNPNSLIEGRDGVLYGTTSSGGSSNNGTVFRINRDGSGHAVLSPSYSWGSSPQGVIEGIDGRIYGVMGSGGSGSAGIIFGVNKDGTGFVVLKNFAPNSDGSSPRGKLIQGSDGALYGNTTTGGTANRGVAYRITTDGSGYVVLHHFLGGTDGIRPTAALAEYVDGMLYGVTMSGGSGTRGTLYRMKKDGSEYVILKSLYGGIEGSAGSHTVLLASDGTMFAATSIDGADTWGTIFKLDGDGGGFAVIRHLGAPDGALPFSPVKEASNGVLYGTTFAGGGSARGTIYRLNKDGTGFSVLHRFVPNVGQHPLSPIIEGTDGMLYGTASNVVFKIGKDGSGFNIVYSESAGVQGIIEASDGALYGTSSGGTNGAGSVFRTNKDGSGYTILRSFVGGATDGKWPYCGVIEAANGKLYGTTIDGGGAARGTVYSLNKDGTGYTVLRQFAGGAADGAIPYAGLIQGSDGFLYGTTTEGGSNNAGTVYRINVDGSGFALVKQFAGGTADGLNPYYAGVVEKNGVLYGITAGGGTFNKGILFAVNRDGTGYQIMTNFGAGMSDGATPAFGLTKASDDALYGTTGYGAGGGTVFRLRTN